MNKKLEVNCQPEWKVLGINTFEKNYILAARLNEILEIDLEKRSNIHYCDDSAGQMQISYYSHDRKEGRIRVVSNRLLLKTVVKLEKLPDTIEGCKQKTDDTTVSIEHQTEKPLFADLKICDFFLLYKGYENRFKNDRISDSLKQLQNVTVITIPDNLSKKYENQFYSLGVYSTKIKEC